ncbi:MAG: hypothetical protein JSW68_11660 [Burkholderiales bacterium]|nr:MAG: hypothetical protein JSW68_11660 [Burkholderiales bacterium]
MVRQLLERRFPLDLTPSIDGIWALYNEAKAAHWNPARDIDWSHFAPGSASAAARASAAVIWSHRVWLGYGHLTATPALLVRFCLEQRREADPKYFLSVRGTEEARHVDAALRYARLLGEYLAAPEDPAYAKLFERAGYVSALDADLPLEAYLAADVALRLSIELAQLEAALEHAATEPVARAVLARLAADKRRHAEFGWLYLQARSGRIEASAIAAAGERIDRLLADEAAGLTVPQIARGPIAEQAARAAGAGLGVLGRDAAVVVLGDSVEAARARLAPFGIRFGARDFG